MRVYLSFDIEQDCPPFRDTYQGIENGLPKIIKLLDEKDIKATFFVTGDVARKYPKKIKEIVEKGHELGCHGNTHARFDKIRDTEAEKEIRDATKSLSEFDQIKSFRAPNLQFPKRYLKLLRQSGYMIDSTLAKHKKLSNIPHIADGILRLPVSTTSIILKTPKIIRNRFLKRLKDPVVIFFHPWEFIDLRREKLRFDCRYNTGDKTYLALSEIIDFYKASEAQFQRIKEFIL